MEHRKNLSLESIEGEIWKDVLGYEGKYQISNFGRVKSLRKYNSTGINYRSKMPCGYFRKEKILKQSIHQYYFVQLGNGKRNNTHFIHKLVAKSFIPNPNAKPYINHINGIKTDNRIENLEWCTAQENTIHGWRTGLMTSQRCEKSTSSKTTIQFTLLGDKIKEWVCAAEAARELSIHKGNISRACRGELKQYGGFKWQYA